MNNQTPAKVGFKNPPIHTRFKKGAPSPNPAGRPKGSCNLKTDFLEEMNERIPVTEGGKRHKYSKQKIALKALIAKAMKGDIRAAGKMFDLYLKMCGADNSAEPHTDLSVSDHEILKAFLDRYAVRD
jgi:hypothetical protein